jgi:hypothetical protein
MSMCYTNVAGDWIQTIGLPGVPWNVEPALARLRGFELAMASPDLLHVWHIGMGRDFLASVIVLLVSAGYFGRLGQWDAANRSLKIFSVTNKLQLKTEISRESLSYKKGEFPELHCKGNQTIIIHRWLQSLASDGFNGLAGMAPVAQMVCDSAQFLALCMSGDHFLSEENARECLTCGVRFLASYVRANQEAAAKQQLLFFIRPKFHLFQHLVLMSQRPSRRSAHLDSLWMDEDFVGKIMRILKVLHPNSADLRVLERYVLDEDCFTHDSRTLP